MLQPRPYLKAVTIRRPEGEATAAYPFCIPSLRHIDEIEFDRDLTFFIGENGSGKSTLLEAIATVMEFGAQGGTGNFEIEDESGLSKLHNYMRPRRSFQRPRDKFFLRAETLFNVGTYFEEMVKEGFAPASQVYGRYGGKSLHHRSHGESFLTILNESMKGNGLYILDEPEAALSPTRQLEALARINQLILDESQFIIATHSPILMAYPNARLYLFDDAGIRKVDYTETEHYRVTKDFLNDHEKRIRSLLSKTPLLDLLDEE